MSQQTWKQAFKIVARNQVKIPVADLALGMYVCHLDRPWVETPFLFQGFQLRTERDLAQVRQHCQHVYVDTNKGVWRTSGSSTNTPRDLTEELPIAKRLHQRARGLVHDVIDQLRLGQSVNPEAIREVISNTVDSVLRNPDAMIWLTQIRNKDEYTADHCLNVSILAAAFGSHLGLPRHEIEALSTCGMLHDVGKTQVPLRILNKQGQLNAHEHAEIKLHTYHGRNILLSSNAVFSGAADVAYCHHERLDGTGYPRRLTADQIPHAARLVALCDAYDAMTSSRVYQRARSPLDALSIIYSERDTHFDAALALEFIECVGIYPPGSIVEMTNGEIGLVVSLDPVDKLRPRVLLILDGHKRRCRARIVDLARHPLDAAAQPYQIRTALPEGAHGIHVADHIEDGLLIEQSNKATPSSSAATRSIDPKKTTLTHARIQKILE